MSVLQLFDQTAPLVSGYSMRSRYISESMVKHGLKVRAISSPIFQYSVPEERLNGVSYMHSKIPAWNVIRYVPAFKEFCIVESICNKVVNNWSHDIRVIDAHSSVLNGVAGSRLAERFKVPFIYEIRALWEDAAVDQGKTKEGSWRYNFTRDLETKIIKKADKITVICEGLKKDIMGRGIDESKIAVIPNGVDTRQFSPVAIDESIVAKYGLKDKKVFGFIGTFFEFEGLDILLKSAKQILEKRKDIKFMIVGGGRHDKYLKELAQQLGIAESVIFTGRVKHDDVIKYYSVIDVLIYPRISKRITELVTPLKPLEAMALEKIVIGSDVGGIKELIKDKYNGLLFKHGDVSDLTDKCLYALDNMQAMTVMAKQAREYVVKERNWFNICYRYLDILKELGVT